MSKKNIALLFGGASTEHSISCKSVMNFIQNINTDKYNVSLIGITKEGSWYLYRDDKQLIEKCLWQDAENKKQLFADLCEKKLFYVENDIKNALDIDLFFPVLHGKHGEDGTIQGFFEMLGARYAGCGVSASANAMDKSMTKLIVNNTGIKQAEYVLVDKHSEGRLEELADQAIERFGFPVFIKPCASGSSIGICKAKTEAELVEGIKAALCHDTRVLLEKFINARELECAVMETKKGFVAAVGEVCSADEFYDFDSKYNNSDSKTTTKPDISPELCEKIKHQAIEIFKILNCRGLSRVDFFLDRDSGELIFNEINTLPGFTSISMFPMLIKGCGYNGARLIDELIDAAL